MKIPWISSAISNFEINSNYCSNWFLLAPLHPCENNHPTKAKNCRQNFTELNILGFDFTIGFKCSDIHRFEKIVSLSTNMFELSFYQYRHRWKHNLIPFEISKIELDKTVDLIIYKDHYALKKINLFPGSIIKSFICRRCLNSYTNENALINNKENFGVYDIKTIRASTGSHLHWKKHFNENPLYCRISKLIMKTINLV